MLIGEQGKRYEGKVLREEQGSDGKGSDSGSGAGNEVSDGRGLWYSEVNQADEALHEHR